MTLGARARRWALTGGWIGGLALAITVLPLGLAADAVSEDQAGDIALFASGIAVLAAFSGTIGFILKLKVPANQLGSLMYVGGWLLASVLVAWTATVLLREANGPMDIRAGVAALWGYVMLPVAIVVGFTAVGIYFPDGRLPGRRWRVPVGALAAALVGASVITALSPFPVGSNLALNPIMIGGMPLALSSLAGVLTAFALFGSFLAATTAAIVRWRRSQGIERAQMKWFVGGFSIAMALFLVSWGSDIGGDTVDVLSVMGMSLIPVAIGIAVLRYRLYEIDRIISRTISWSITTGLIVAVFAGIVVGLQGILAEVTGGNTVAVAASTLVAFALFQPLRRRVQGAVDHRFNRSGYDAQRTVDAFAERVRLDVDLAGLGAALAATAGEAVRPAGVGIWIRHRPADAA